MTRRLSRGYWLNFENCKNAALSCKGRQEFREKYYRAYENSIKNNWIIKFKNIPEIIKPNGYWTRENCLKAALECKTKQEFRKKYSAAYNYVYKNKWVECFKHMVYIGNRFNRCIYAYEFPDKSVYIGLTFNINDRIISRKSTKRYDGVNEYSKKTKQIPKFVKITKYIPVNIAIKKEKEYITKYKNNGWNILNRAKAGGTGGTPKWNIEKCSKTALQYKTRSEFARKNSGAYEYCRENKILEIVCAHMIEKSKPNGYWTYEKCKEAALDCVSATEFQKKYSGARTIIRQNKWYNLFNHFIPRKTQNGYYNDKNICKKLALQYKNISLFGKKCHAAYNSMIKNGWRNEFFPINKNKSKLAA